MPDLRNNNDKGSPILVPGVVEWPGGRDLSRLSSDLDSSRGLQEETLLMEYYRVLARHRKAIFLCAVSGAVIAFLCTLGVLPVYRARTSLDIQSLNADFMGMRDVAPTGQGANSSDESYIQTQIKLLQSDTLRQRTAARLEREGLVHATPQADLLSQIKSNLHLTTGKFVPSKDLLANAAKNVTIKSIGATRLVEATCDSWDAKFSAQFCNALTSEFAAQDREVRWNEAQRTSEWLSRQLADVRQSLADSERKLESAAGNDAVMQSQAGGSVAIDKLRELQSELMKAEADRVAKEAQYAISTSAPPDSLPVVLDSGSLRETEAKLEDLRRQVAALVPPLTLENPKVQHLTSQIHELERSVGLSRSNVLTRMRNEYDAARQREGLLQGAYAAQEKKVSQDMGKEAQVNMLRHEVESGQQLYQTLLQRVKEAGFASALQASTIRVVDPAVAPQVPVSPRRNASALIGFLLGALGGVAFSFFRERTQTMLRAPGEVPRYLNLRELGVIPSAKRGLGFVARPPAAVRTGNSLALAAAPVPPEDPTKNRVLDMTVWQDQASLLAEAYRNATYSILLAGKHIEGAKAYVVSSPNVSDGKTTVTCNLGLALAQANRKVLLIDGDVRKPRLHKAMRVVNELGLRNWLRGDVDLATTATSVLYQTTDIPNLSILTSGTGSEEPSGLLHSPRFATLLKRLQHEFDIILIDSPPMLHLADARILSGSADGVILVFRARSTDRETAMAARDLFLQDRVPVIGTILNDFDPAKEGKAAYYQNYYEYSHAAKDASKTA